MISLHDSEEVPFSLESIVPVKRARRVSVVLTVDRDNFSLFLSLSLSLSLHAGVDLLPLLVSLLIVQGRNELFLSAGTISLVVFFSFRRKPISRSSSTERGKFFFLLLLLLFLFLPEKMFCPITGIRTDRSIVSTIKGKRKRKLRLKIGTTYYLLFSMMQCVMYNV